MASIKLSEKERMNMITGLQIRFDKLTKETGVLNGVLPVKAVIAPPLPAPAVLPKILAEKGIRPDIDLKKMRKSRMRRIKTAKMNKWIKISELRRVICRLKWQE